MTSVVDVVVGGGVDVGAVVTAAGPSDAHAASVPSASRAAAATTGRWDTRATLPAHRLPAMPRPVVLDVDTGVDDACALLLAALSPRPRPARGLAASAATRRWTSSSPTRSPCWTRPAVTTSRWRPAAPGPCSRPPATPGTSTARTASAISTGRGRPAARSPARGRAAARRHPAAPEPVTLVTLAPLTNVALLLRTYPDVAAGLRDIVVMGGAANVGNATASAEFNVFHDPEAAAIALDAAADLSIAVTLYGLDVFYQPTVTGAQARRLAAAVGPGRPARGAPHRVPVRAVRRPGHHRRRRRGVRGPRPRGPADRAPAGPRRARRVVVARAAPSSTGAAGPRPEPRPARALAGGGRRRPRRRRTPVRGAVARHGGRGVRDERCGRRSGPRSALRSGWLVAITTREPLRHPLRRRREGVRPLMGRVVVVGSVQPRVVVDVLRIPAAGETATSRRTRRSIGGRGMLQAVAAQRSGGRVALVAAIGDDETGRWCRESARAGRDRPAAPGGRREPTGHRVVAREDGDRDAVILIPGADAALDGRRLLPGQTPTTWS